MSAHVDYLCSIRTNLIQSSHSAIEKVNYLIEIVISDTPRPIHQERQISFGCFAHWGRKARILELEQCLNSSWNLINHLRKCNHHEKPLFNVSSLCFSQQTCWHWLQCRCRTSWALQGRIVCTDRSYHRLHFNASLVWLIISIFI